MQVRVLSRWRSAHLLSHSPSMMMVRGGWTSDISARARQEHETAADRLTAANTLDFARVQTSVSAYQ
ncbi:hypothetical protein C5C18_14060 [Rathayibacter tritici]|nr:hypothetical protein C5C06_13150 [Rathayibacter tritici]PPF62968.1 hypothetical protein C5C21_13710 [Rathayibacter tritici]PPG04050.1 hypothetical protein C5C18_14060 [Rathayibacter tritici]PPI19385.1 hypothetical protein C5D07_01880 [Rathayibacter tritici]